MITSKHKLPLGQKDLALVYDVAKSIHAIRNLDDMLQHIFQLIKDVVNVEGASLALHDPDQHEFYFIRTVEHDAPATVAKRSEVRFADHIGVAGWVLRKNKTAIIQNAYSDKRFFKGIDQREGFKTRSMICVPLRSRKGVMGVLYALNKLSGDFTEREAKLLEVLSGSIAISVENAKLYGELSRYAHQLETENRQLKSNTIEQFNLQGIIGTSPAMRRLFSLVEKAMITTINVLLTGETGTGKELVAKVIHYGGPLKDKPFVVENCGALAENLLESELFGHVKGAYTGALSDKKGLFELADGGTVFLDEIGETSPAMQVKLLRVLQEGHFRPVGGQQTVRVNVRLIATTNRDLEAEVRKGTFREDLFYRINVFPIKLPSLVERRQDIPLLANFFLKRFAEKYQCPANKFTTEAMNLLSRYDWPGNVRQLEHEIERAVAIAGDLKVIRTEHLSTKVNPWPAGGHAPNASEDTMKTVVERIEQQMIRMALQEKKGNRSEAAIKLGLTRQGLLNKIKRYHLE